MTQFKLNKIGCEKGQIKSTLTKELKLNQISCDKVQIKSNYNQTTYLI